MNKRVLFITYYWPPSGGPGVQRIIYFVKYLRKFGYEPVILTVKDGEYPAIDRTFEKIIPEGIKVYKSKALEPFTLYKRLLGKKKDHKIDTYIMSRKEKSLPQKLLKWIRLNIFIPDARIGWYPYAVKLGKKIIQDEQIDLIFSSSPPHSLQVTARRLAALSNKPWVADFRDPWSTIWYYQDQKRTWLTKWIDSRLERKAITSNDRIVVTCKGLKEQFEKYFGVSSEKVKVVTNGFEPTAISTKSFSPEGPFKIFYAGNLSTVRVPYPLLEALKKFKNTHPEKPIKFVIAGTVSPKFWEAVRERAIEELIDYLGYISHQEVLDHYQKADLLLLVIDDIPNPNLFIPGKLFDYLGSRKPVFGIGPKNGEVHKIIKETNSGYFFDYQENEKAFEQLKALVEKRAELSKLFTFEGIEQYTREQLTKKLTSTFDEVLTEAGDE